MLRSMNGKTRRNRIRNDIIRERVRVTPTIEKLVGNILRQFRHVDRRYIDAIIKRIDQMNENRVKKSRIKPKKIIRKTIRNDI